MKRCSKILVKGKVNGVFYRDFVKKQAEKFNIEGTIQNVNDGTVLINACGTSESFANFIDALYEGTPKAAVEQIDEEPITGKDFRGVFRIIGMV